MLGDSVPAYFDDKRHCARCGDPLPVDGKCDCAGTERDVTLPRNQLSSKRQRVLSRYGFVRSYPET